MNETLIQNIDEIIVRGHRVYIKKGGKIIMPYFIDDNIWFQNKRMEPRKVYCYKLFFDDYGFAHFEDKDGDLYKLPKDRILYEEVK